MLVSFIENPPLQRDVLFDINHTKMNSTVKTVIMHLQYIRNVTKEEFIVDIELSA